MASPQVKRGRNKKRMIIGHYDSRMLAPLYGALVSGAVQWGDKGETVFINCIISSFHSLLNFSMKTGRKNRPLLILPLPGAQVNWSQIFFLTDLLLHHSSWLEKTRVKLKLYLTQVKKPYSSWEKCQPYKEPSQVWERRTHPFIHSYGLLPHSRSGPPFLTLSLQRICFHEIDSF